MIIKNFNFKYPQFDKIDQTLFDLNRKYVESKLNKYLPNTVVIFGYNRALNNKLNDNNSNNSNNLNLPWIPSSVSNVSTNFPNHKHKFHLTKWMMIHKIAHELIYNECSPDHEYGVYYRLHTKGTTRKILRRLEVLTKKQELISDYNVMLRCSDIFNMKSLRKIKSISREDFEDTTVIDAKVNLDDPKYDKLIGKFVPNEQELVIELITKYIYSGDTGDEIINCYISGFLSKTDEMQKKIWAREQETLERFQKSEQDLKEDKIFIPKWWS